MRSAHGGQPAASEVTVPTDLAVAMVGHARAEHPLEACGLVAGRGGAALRFYRARNALQSPTRYDLDPRDLLRVTMEIEAARLDLWGIFHSHPQTEAYPSQTDIRLAFYPAAFYLICSLADPRAPVLRAFRIEAGAVSEFAVRTP